MCKTFSGIGMKTGELYFIPSIDSHEDLVSIFNINDNGIKKEFVRLEYVPKNGDYSDLAQYNLTIDEDNVNKIEWLNDELKDIWINHFKNIIEKLIIEGKRFCLFDGTYILKNSEIRKLINCKIIYAGSATIKNAGSATIEHAGSATIEYAGSATIKDAGSATIKYAGSATIKDAGSATIKYAGSATIEYAGSATIEDAGSATIEDAGSATIKNAGSATIEDAGSATIKDAGSATINN
jgi:hypothetical protein